MFSTLGTGHLSQSQKQKLLGVVAAISACFPLLNADSPRLPLVWMTVANAIGLELNCPFNALEKLVHLQVFVDTRKKWRKISEQLKTQGLQLD